ncbi:MULTISPECIES: TetR/AcrR family transcriptional regulator [unclassified Kitasatospora]|uniref:TetR/AcrR family transcriptional regulator n=1 Tax=unclassified Kitasatospora TaxID=2633591 RepID=UPI00070C1982|nr:MULTISPECIES: TetR/AcrR family transcriptional regulator [unclassified Kitasatospora]KQV09927.1 TetR family transcriptional regulator [Kitasatospora sp. Root107]KRB70167.1 TetR family transcriptional regulator [Kitasatospora sp. Root187]
MSPRGVAIPDIRERLFTAAEQVLTREGPGALTSRAITGEAGCAKGMLHAHFAGLDEFVAELVLDRFARAAHQAEGLQHRVGQATVPENLRGVALALLSSAGPTLAGLALTRPGASEQIRQALSAGAPGFATVQDAITAYLDREQQHGRLPATDTATIALALVGTVHHLLMTGQSGTPDAHDRIERLTTLLGATGPGR